MNDNISHEFAISLLLLLLFFYNFSIYAICKSTHLSLHAEKTILNIYTLHDYLLVIVSLHKLNNLITCFQLKIDKSKLFEIVFYNRKYIPLFILPV